MVHALLITLHAAAGIAAAAFGCRVLLTPSAPRRRHLVGFAAATAVLAVALVVVVPTDWLRLEPAQRIVFSALAALAVVLVGRAAAALRALDRGPSARVRLVQHVGFVVVSLLDAFCVVTAVDLALPPFAIGAVAVLAIPPGVLLTRRAVRIAAQSRSSASASVSPKPAGTSRTTR